MREVQSTDPAFETIRRAEFPELAPGYLDAASIAPLPLSTRKATEAFNRLRGRPQDFRAEDFTCPVEDARAASARLIGAGPDEIALLPNTSFGLNVVALGLRLPPGSIVLTSEREFPANVYPWWGRESYELELLPVTPDGWPDEERMLERLRDPAVAVLAISSVQFSNGYRIDLDRLGAACQEANVLFVVDAIQSLGQVPLDVAKTPVDIIATGGHKWLCSPLGTGFLYLAERVWDRIRPEVKGWLSVEASQRMESVVQYDPVFLPDARRFEVGTLALQDLAGMRASLDLLEKLGIERIQRHLQELLRPLREWLQNQEGIRCTSSCEPEKASAILTFQTADLEGTHRRLRSAGVRCSIREGSIRIAPHFYNNGKDITTVLEVLDDRNSRRPA